MHPPVAAVNVTMCCLMTSLKTTLMKGRICKYRMVLTTIYTKWQDTK